MAEPSSDTKNTANKLSLGGIGKSLLGGAKKAGGAIKSLFVKKPVSEYDLKGDETPAQVLGKIYKLMKVMDEDKKRNHEMANSRAEEEELEKKFEQP